MAHWGFIGGDRDDSRPRTGKVQTRQIYCYLYVIMVYNVITYMPALWNFKTADFEPYYAAKKYTTFSFTRHEALP